MGRAFSRNTQSYTDVRTGLELGFGCVMERFESVWDAISDTPEEAANLRVRAELIHIRTGMRKKDLPRLVLRRPAGYLW